MTDVLASIRDSSPVSGEMLVGEFIVVFFIAAIITIAKAKDDRNPVKLGFIMGLATGLVAVVFTIILTGFPT